MAKSWVVIDSRVSDKELLISQLAPGTGYQVLDASLDGIGQIVTALTGQSGYDSIQIISHGSPGSITIGATVLDHSSLDHYAAELALIGHALTDTGDLLLYGCNVGAGAEGEQFVETLSHMTGADVAASDDPTGVAAAGGDWTLEVQSGVVDSTGLQESASLEAYSGVLATLTNAGFESDLNSWVGHDVWISTGGDFSNGWTVSPYGSKMAVLQPSGSDGRSLVYSTLMVGTAGQDYLNTRFSNPTNFSYLYQDISLASGETISLAWNYIATDYSPYNDASWVSFVNKSNAGDASMQIGVGAYGYTMSQVAILGATVDGTGNYVTGDFGSTGWQILSLKAGTAGVYRIGFAVFNLVDTAYTPYLLVDQARGLTYHNGVAFEPIGPAVDPPPPPGLVGPTLTAFSGPVETGTEDTEMVISLHDLMDSGDEADTGGTVVAFIVESVSSGTLKIGTDAASATPFDATTNNKIDETHHAYWMPALNENGVRNAFAVYAMDNDGLLSATAVQAPVSVTPVNDAPVTQGPAITGFTEQTPVQLGSDIVISDPDGDAGWDGGVLRVQITANAEGGDSLSLPSANPGGTAVWLDPDGCRLMAGDLEIGIADVVSVSGDELWSFSFNANATNDSVQEVARSLVFSNSSDQPGAAARTVTLTLIDNEGAAGYLDRVVSITQVNDAPVFTGFSGVVGVANEDTETEITLEALQAQGDAADVDGTVDAFVVRSVSTGSLKIGTDAASAEAYDAVTNNTIDATHHAYWTGDQDANGIFDAFSVVAKDNEGAESDTLVQATVEVTPVNDPPVLLTFSAPVATTDEDAEVAITFDALLAQGDESDIEGFVDAFLVRSVDNGSLKIGTDAASATAWDPETNFTIDAVNNAYWTPAADANGTLGAFSVVARDDSGDASIGPVQVPVDVLPTYDPPVITGGDVSGGITPQTPDFNGSLTFSNPDLGDIQAEAASLDETLGSVVAVVTSNESGNGVVSWHYSVDPGAVAYLAEGETKEEFFSIRIDDGIGGFSTQDVSVTITGANDAPVRTAGDFSASITEGTGESPHQADGSLSFSDPDLPDRPVATAVMQSVSGLHSDGSTPLSLTEGQRTAIGQAFTISEAEGNTSDGTINWHYAIDESALDFLSEGEIVTGIFTITVDDGHGLPNSSFTQDISVTIYGTNDAPVITPAVLPALPPPVGEGEITELIVPAGTLTDSGAIGFSDTDLADSHNLSAVTASAGALGSMSVTITEDTTGKGAGGVLTWNYSVDAAAVEYLAGGEHKVESFTFSLLDGHGGSSQRTIDVVITGTDEDLTPPTLIASTPADNATAVALGSDISLTFNENVQAGSGSVVLSNGHGDTRIIDIHDSSQVSISGSVVTINPSADLLRGSSYSVQMPTGVIKDLSGNDFAGIVDSTTLNFTTVSTLAVYSNDFDGHELFGDGLSGGLSGYLRFVDVSGFAANGFTGQMLYNDTAGNPATATTLVLNNLPDHNAVDINFLLAFIDSWDSTNGSPAPDWFNVSVDGVSILQITAANASGSYTYNGNELGTAYNRGFSGWADRAFDMSSEPLLTVAHTGSTLTIQFNASGNGWQGWGDESWAVENLQVIIDGFDTVAPTLTSSTPGDHATAVALGSTIALTFSEQVQAGSGSVVISNGNGDTRTIDINDSSQVTIAGNTVTIDPSADLLSNSDYTLQLSGGAIQDHSGNPFAASGAGTVLNFRTINTLPVFTALSASVVSAAEDHEAVITLDDFMSKADASDPDGTITAFVIRAVTSGSLKIGTDAASATAWNAVTNNTVDATHHAYWTPAADANGILGAFTVVARDDSGAESIGAVQATVDVAPLNDAPALNAGADAHTVEGSWFSRTITLGDPDPDSHLIRVNWGDGSGETEFDSAGQHHLDLTHYYADNGNYTVTVRADDYQGQPNSVETDTFQVIADNIAPSASVTGDERVNEGANYLLHVGAVTDPGMDTRSGYGIDWGDGSSDSFTPGEWAAAAGAFSHTYHTSSTTDIGRNITVYATDEDGSFVLGGKQVTVNVPPDDIVISNHTIAENSDAGTVVGTLSTPDSAPQTYTLLDSAGGRFTLSGDQILVAAGATLDYESDPVHTIRVRATDAEGLSIDKDLSITLGDMGPDMIVSSVGSTQTITDIDLGSPMEIYWTITTQGLESSNASWTDRVYFDDPSTPGLDRWIGDYAVTMALPLSEALTRIQTVQLPSNLYGDFRIVVVTDVNNQVAEGSAGETNNATSGDTTYSILSSNLQVASVTAPSSAFTGREIDVEWIVGNVGNAGTMNRAWYDTVYLSADTVLDSQDIALHTVRNESYLNAGDQYHNTATITLPSGITGEYHILVKTDVYNQVPEGDFENDNASPSAVVDIQPIPLSELSDPAVVSVAAPTQALSGQSMSLTYTIDNAGQAAISGSSPYWVERIYMSSDEVLDGSDRLLNTIWRDVSSSQLPQPEGATHFTTTEKVMLPVGVSGNYYFFVTVSPVGSVTNAFLSNDSAYDATPVDVRLTPPPDLRVSGIASPSTALAGHDLTVSYRVLNVGTTSTPNTGWNDALYLSTDTTLDAGDTLLSDVWHSGKLDPAGRAQSLTLANAIAQYARGGATGYYINTATVHLPDGLNGTYYLIASSDTHDVVFELDNANNTGSAVALSIESRPADLVVSDLTAPSVAQAGQSLRVSWSVLNQGIGDTGASSWSDRIILSGDNILGNGDDVLLGSYVHTGTLAAGQSYSNSALVSMPANLSGNYQLFVTTDSFNQVYEASQEGNNSRPLGVGLNWQPGDEIPDIGIDTRPQSTPDLQVVSVTAPQQVNSGESLSITYTVTNAGAGSTNTNHWWDSVILSGDAIVGNGDDLLLGTAWHAGTLAPGGSYTATASLTVPIDLSGEYHVFVRTDANGYVTEPGAENNNDGAASSTTTIDLSPVPDMVISNVQASNDGVSGQNLSVSWTIHNDGADTSGGWRQVFYLSRDGILDRNSDIYLGYADTWGGLAADADVNLAGTFRIPVGISGKYYVFGVVDSGNWIYERGGENNNTAIDSTPVQITAPEPVDLVAGVVTVPENGVAGGSASIQYTVTNESAQALSGHWRDNIYLSSDAVWDVNDALFDRVEIDGPLAAGGSYTHTATGTLPGLIGGDYYVIVRSDILNQVIESSESNNLSASVDSTHLDVEVLSLGTPDSGVLSQGGAVYYRVDAQAGETLQIGFDRDASAGRTELYVSYGDMPSRSDFDYRYSVADSPDQSIVIANAKGGSYYIMAYNTVGSTDSYTVTADVLDFSITKLGTTQGSNLGEVTVRIDGAKFSTHTLAALVGGDGVEHAATSIYWKDSATLWATFDLQGMTVGSYDVKLDDEGGTALVEDGFTVNHGKAGYLEYNAESPSYLRLGDIGVLTVNYSNEGFTDVTAPLLVISGEAVFRQTTDTEFGGSEVQLLGISNDGPAGILSPGASGSVKLYFKPLNTGAHELSTITVSTITPGEVIDWNTILDANKPDNISTDAWETVKANLIAELGTTAGDYQDNLARIATYLDQLEGRTNNIDLLFSLDFQKASDGGNLLRPATLGVLGYSQVFAWDITASSQTDGSVLVDIAGSKLLFTQEADGSYKLVGQGTASLAESGGAFVLLKQDGTSITFNLDGRFDTIQDSNGHTTQALYADGQLIQVSTDTGRQLSFTYNEDGRLIEEVDQTGRSVSYAYDAENLHLLSVTSVDGTTQYSYITVGAAQHLLSTITFADGTVRHFGYDGQGRLTSQYLNDHAEMLTYSYVGVNEVIVTDASGASAHLWIDERGLVSQAEDALGRVTQLHYDDNGNLTGVVNTDGTSSSMSYDANGDVVSVQDALGHTLAFSYETSFGQLAQAVDQRGNATGFGYDEHGNLASITYADGSQANTGYDASGNMDVSVSRSGQSIGYSYDAQGHLIQKSFADGTTASFTWDDHGNLTSATDADSHTTFEYDAADHLIKVTDTDGRWIGYSYDDAGRRIGMSDQEGNVTHYSYDAHGHLSAVTDGSGTLIAAYQYDAVGNLSRGDNGNGTWSTYEYDAAGQLLHLVNYQEDGSVNSRFDYTYDEMGHRTSERTLEGTTNYTYDAIGQLTEVTLSDGRHIGYHYDAAGNRISVEDDAVSTNYATNNLNEYTSAGAVTYGYDANGNLVSKTEGGIETTYGYDAENHMVSVSTPTDNWSYEYDALGNRIASVHNGDRIEYQLDPTGMVNVAAEYDASGNLTASYVYGLGLESETLAGGTTAWYDFNAIGSTVGLSGSGGDYLNHYTYLPFGETLSVSETIANSFEYIGQWGVMDEGNGLDFMRARYYSADEGRFTSTDAMKAPWVNTYGYADNDPLYNLDPEGLETFSLGFNLSGGAAAGGTVEINLVWDGSSWDPRVQVSVGGGGFGGVSGSGNIAITATNAPDASSLTGVGFQVGGSAGEVIGAGGELVGGKGYTGFCFSGGLTGGATPIELHGFITHTWDLGSLTDLLFRRPETIRPRDPNDIVGPKGYGDENWTGTQSTLPYTIHFENQAAATAPAQEVTVTQTLDSDLDASSFRLGDFGWGDLYVDVPDDAVFYINRLDLSATKGYMVDVVAGIDIVKHEAFWTFTTIDPATGEIPADPTVGFLPPDADGVIGQGFVNYTIQPNAGVTTGTVIDAKATIVFATQEPIDTPAIANTLDVDAPVSQVGTLAGQSEATVTSAQFLVSWSGSDVGSAIASYSVYVSDNGGAATAWLDLTTQTEANYAGQQGHTYAFYTIATDNAGNREAAPAQADLVVHVAADAATSDTLSPQVTGVVLPTARQYVAGETLEFTLRFSETVVIDAAGQPPLLRLTIGSTAKDAVYQTGSGTDALTFRYVIAEGEYDTDGIGLGSEIVTNGAIIRDIAGNPLANLTFAAGSTDGIRIDQAPTLTSFSGPVDQTWRDKPVAIALADLQAKGDETDVDGTVDAFVIRSVTSGTLLIGTSAQSATAYDAMTNNTVDATHQAYWTPELYAHGVLDAFTVVARDNSGMESATPVQATVEVLDAIAGTAGNDTLAGAPVSDHLYGYGGNDTLYGYAGDDLLDGGTGADRMDGGAGNDVYVVDNAGDVVVELAGTAAGTTDTVQSSVSYTLAANVENLTLTGSGAISGKGNVLNNVITGNDGANVLNGATGNDTIFGGGGNDSITGGLGVDVMSGGAGNDLFIFDYLATSESGIVTTSTDIITDFVSGHDRLDLSAIDANVAAAGNQAFNSTILSGAMHFTGAGQLCFDSAAGMLYGNTDGNILTAELTIQLTGLASLAAADVIL